MQLTSGEVLACESLRIEPSINGQVFSLEVVLRGPRKSSSEWRQVLASLRDLGRTRDGMTSHCAS